MKLPFSSVLSASALVAATAFLAPSDAVAQSGGKTLRFIPQSDLRVLDPIWTTGYVVRNHAYMIYEDRKSTRLNSSHRT